MVIISMDEIYNCHFMVIISMDEIYKALRFNTATTLS